MATPDGKTHESGPAVDRQPIANLRWWINGLLLFASTVINYLDRQTLSLLAPFLKQDYHWTNTDYANLLIGFRVAYFHRANGLRQTHGPVGNQARTQHHGPGLFHRFHVHFTGERIL